MYDGASLDIAREAAMDRLERVYLDRDLKRSLQAQLADQMKAMIQSGRLRANQRLPSTRSMAEQLRVSRNTVVAAYESLYGEGYLQGRERSSFIVGSATQAFRSRPQQPAAGRARARTPLQPAAPRPFRPAQPDVKLFPLKIWNRHRTKVLRRDSSLLQYQSRFSIGLDELRQNVAGYLRDSRGVRCDWDQVAITGGSQQALFLLGHLLLDSDKSAYMEDPGYPGARRSWEAARATVVPVPVDHEGIHLPLPDARDASLIYVTPSHQFPLGTCMSLARRLALLDVARERSLWIIEDDYDAEFRYSSAPQPSLQGLDEHQRVIYMGSFSKTLFPGLRLGFIVLPPELVEPFTRLKMVADDQGPLIDQATLAAFLESGAFYAHLRRCRRVYSERQQFFVELIRRTGLPLEFPITGRGMNLAGRLIDDRDDKALSERLGREGLDIPALSGYGIQTKIRGLLFGMTAFDETEIAKGLEDLARGFG
jgi:GntR family transcriptional regulator/MocR family aminotransferase